MKPAKHICKGCGKDKVFRADQLYCSKECVTQDKLGKEVSEMSGNDWAITLPKTRIHTLDELIEFCKIDLSVWEVERFVCNKWEVAAKDASSELQVEPLFQIKAFLRRRVHVVAARQEIDALKELAKRDAPKPKPVAKPKSDNGNMLEINIADHHFGKLAWGTETGGAHYDVKIATAVFGRAFSTLLARSAQYNYDEIWFVVGNDLLNSDDPEGRTTKGTYVSTDSRYHRTFSVVRNLLIDAIETLRERARTVKVIMVSGNHDRLSVWHMGDSLECYFHNYKDVQIDNSPQYYKYHQFGKVMLMYTHGDKGRIKEYPLLMATEQPAMFGATAFREAHIGHKHTLQVDEQHGVRVRTCPALCPQDAWHAENAFVGNLRASEAFIWNREQGLLGTAIFTEVAA